MKWGGGSGAIFDLDTSKRAPVDGETGTDSLNNIINEVFVMGKIA